MANEFLGASAPQNSDGLEGTELSANTGDDTRNALSQLAFAPPADNHLRNLGIATGVGLGVGAAGTAAGEIALVKLVAEPLANGVGRSLLGAIEPLVGRSLGFTPSNLKLAQVINPKRVLIGAVATAAVAAAGYEIQYQLTDSKT